MKIKILYIVICFMMSIAAQAQSTALKNVDNYLNSYLNNIPAPGFSISIVEGDQVIFNKGYGIEKQGHQSKMSPQSILHIGALGRGFTAMAVMQLVEQGKLDLDVPITTYIPWFQTANPSFSEQITLRMCLSNTTAIPPQYESMPSLSEVTALEDFIRSFEGLMIKRKPGLSHEFSDEGYSIAGYIISKITGQSYDQYVQDNILNPLQMTRSAASQKLLGNQKISHGHEMGLTECIPAVPDNPDSNYEGAGSGFYSTVEDLSHYMIALLKDGQYKGAQVISPSSIEALFQSNTSFEGLGTMLGGNGIDIQYALGWMGMEIEERPIMLHTGSNGKVASIIGINRRQNQAFAILFNTDVNQLDRFEYPGMENTINNVIHLLNGEETTDFGLLKDNLRIDEDFELNPDQYDKFVGRYESYGKQNPFFKDMSIEVTYGKRNLLELTVHQEEDFKGRYELDFTNESRAILRNISQPRQMQFNIYSDGSVGGLFMRGSEFKKVNPSDEDAYREISSPDGTASFQLPLSIKHQWESNDLLVSKNDKLKMRIDIRPLISDSFQLFVSESIQANQIKSKGIINNITVKKGIWTEQTFFVEEGDGLQQYILAVYQDPHSHKQLQLVLSNVYGDFHVDTVKMIQQIQRTVELR